MSKRVEFALAILLAFPACSEESADEVPNQASDAAAGDTGGAGDSDIPDANGNPSIRGVRYCEILIGTLVVGEVHVEVWGTQGLNLCPAEVWDALDGDTLRADLGVAAVVMNGPRHWLIDSVEASSVPSTTIREFGGLEMRQLATVTVPLGELNQLPYIERVVNRDTRFRFDAGVEVYELTAPSGSVYVMQSSSQIVDSALMEADLPTLGSRLDLPDGWIYASRLLDAPLDVLAEGAAVVLQDDLANTYSRRVVGDVDE